MLVIFFVTDTAVTEFENSLHDGLQQIVHDWSANRAHSFLTFSLFDDLTAITIRRPENQKALANPFGESLSYLSG